MIGKIKWTNSKFRALSTISADMGQIIFAAWFATIFTQDMNTTTLIVLLIELSSVLSLWILSVYFAEKGKL